MELGETKEHPAAGAVAVNREIQAHKVCPVFPDPLARAVPQVPLEMMVPQESQALRDQTVLMVQLVTMDPGVTSESRDPPELVANRVAVATRDDQDLLDHLAPVVYLVRPAKMDSQEPRDPTDCLAFVESRERVASKAEPVSRDNQVPRVLLDSRVTVVTVAHLAAQASKVFVDDRVRMATVAQLVQLVPLDPRVRLDLKARPDQTVPRVHPAALVTSVTQAQLDDQDPAAQLERREPSAPQEPPAAAERTVNQAHPDHRERLDHRVLQDRQDSRVSRVMREIQVTQDQMDQRDKLVRLEMRALLASKDPLDPVDVMVSLVNRDHVAPVAQLERLVPREPRENKEGPDQQDSRELKVPRVSVVSQERLALRVYKDPRVLSVYRDRLATRAQPESRVAQDPLDPRELEDTVETRDNRATVALLASLAHQVAEVRSETRVVMADRDRLDLVESLGPQDHKELELSGDHQAQSVLLDHRDPRVLTVNQAGLELRVNRDGPAPPDPLEPQAPTESMDLTDKMAAQVPQAPRERRVTVATLVLRVWLDLSVLLELQALMATVAPQESLAQLEHQVHVDHLDPMERSESLALLDPVESLVLLGTVDQLVQLA